MDSINRCIWRQDFRLAKRLLAQTALAQEHLIVDEAGIYCRDPPAFESVYNETRRVTKQKVVDQLSADINSATSLTAKKKVKSRLQAAKRQVALHWRRDKRLSLTGIKLNNDTVCEPKQIQESLIAYWKPVYSPKPFDSDGANKLCRLFCARNASKFVFEDISPMEPKDFEGAIACAKDSATGPNGIPYSAYRGNRKLASQVLCNHADTMMTPERPARLTEFNKQLVWFAPKGVRDDLSLIHI